MLAIRERSYQGKVGRVRFFHIPDAKRDTIHPIIQANVAPNVRRLITDQSSIYDQPVSQDLAKAHRRINHSQEWIVPGSRIHTNTVESAFSLLKRGLIGAFIGFRQASAPLSDGIRVPLQRAGKRPIDSGMTVREMVLARPMQYKQLTAGE